MTHDPPISYVISQVDVLREKNKNRNGRNPDNDWFDACDLDDYMTDLETSMSSYLLVEEYGIDQVGHEEEILLFYKLVALLIQIW